MDVDFVNSYTEVLIENFDAVIKQNLMFQAQLKMLEKKKGESEILLNQLNEKDSSIAQLQQLVNNLQSELSSLNGIKERAIDASFVIDEKNRIQQALNETMQTNAFLRNAIDEKDSVIIEHGATITELNFRIKELEKQVPSQKLKKPTSKKPDTTVNKDSLNRIKVQSGGTF